jgi:hypothetical protein
MQDRTGHTKALLLFLFSFSFFFFHLLLLFHLFRTHPFLKKSFQKHFFREKLCILSIQ